MKPDWYVIIGGPYSGKTTIINELEKLGHCVVQEAAATIINEGILKGKNIDEIRKDENEFTEVVLKKKLENEAKAPRDKIVFFDRGVPDAIAYDKVYNALTNKEVIELCKKRDYARVFFLEMLPYKKTYERVEDKETAEKLSKCLYEAYLEYGYNVVKVPVMSVNERVEFILKKIK